MSQLCIINFKVSVHPIVNIIFIYTQVYLVFALPIITPIFNNYQTQFTYNFQAALVFFFLGAVPVVKRLPRSFNILFIVTNC